MAITTFVELDYTVMYALINTGQFDAVRDYLKIKYPYTKPATPPAP